MLTIRREQMQVFQQLADDKFISTVADHLHSHHAKIIQGLPESILRKRIEFGLQRASDYGLTWQNNLITFITMLFEIGIGFDSHPLFQQHLTDPRVPANSRMEQLLEETSGEDWDSVQHVCANNPWPDGLQLQQETTDGAL